MQSKAQSYLFLLIVLGLAVLSGVLYTLKPFQFGLDVKGGVRLTYQMKAEDIKPDMRLRMDEIRSNMLRILVSRAGGSLGVVEPVVQQKGQDAFIIELPGFTDEAKAKEVMSNTAKIKFYSADNIVSKGRPMAPYSVDEKSPDPKNPSVTFHRTADATKVYQFGDPEYAEILKGWELILEGDDLASAGIIDHGRGPQPEMKFSNSGQEKIERWSRQHLSDGRNIAAVLDGRVLSIAPLKEGAILRESAFIDGTFDTEYLKSLVSLLNAGSLPIGLNLVSSESVSPTIGQFALNQIVMAGLIAFGLICLFLIVYYVFPGIVAVISLCLYVLFTLTALKLANATFSLASIAGFILSVGMAVDANILVFERVKEEMREGKSLMSAIELGFKRALPAIVDSNACTILTCLVLVNLGTGPVKGFASTLIIGVLISLFTAVTVTRSLLVFFVGSGLGNSEKLFGLGRQWFGEKFEAKAHHEPLQIVNTAKKWFLISALTIVPGIIFVAMGGIKPNVELQGGYEASYALPSSGGITASQIAQNLDKAGIKGSTVKITSAGSTALAQVTVPPTPELAGGGPEAQAKVAQAAGFQVTDQRSFSFVGPTIQAETIKNALMGVVISSVLIMFYLAIRFGIALGGLRNGLRFGMSAIGALVHDVFVVMAFASIMGFFFNWEISALFITAMLTIIGFSVHDTIVIFDRIRENLRRQARGEDFGHLCNRSITQSFARSINTSFTVVLTLAILIGFGTATIDLKFFCAAMLVGIVSGTYSSIYNAAPILYLWDKAVMKRKGEEAGLMAEAAREHARLRAAALTVDRQQPAAAATGVAAGSAYGQVKRRSSAVTKATHTIDDE